MTSVIPTSEFFTAGGTLPPDAPSYVKRPTDDELYRNIKAGEFCYVLTPRQMGKSSLMIRTSRRLMQEGVKSAIVDLTQIGTVESEDQWYKGILSQVRRRLRISLDPVAWWEQRRDIPNIQKFIEFFEEALAEVQEHVVIFMDEIDTTLKLDFRDNFFAGIRALYNARAENPDLRRITFVLLGVASPSDLIKDRSRTPFNIGQEIPLKPFSREDARMLEQGLEAAYPGQAQRILNRVFYWTSGHPYLTQKICQSVVDNPLSEYDNDSVDRLVESLFISEEARRETNLQFVRDTVLYYPDRKDILSLYKKVLQEKEVRDHKNSVSQNHLKLAGLVGVDNGRLVISNNIYARVFDLGWVNRYTEVNWSRRISVALGIIVVFLLVVIAHDAMYLPGISQQASDDVSTYNDDRGIHALAELFRLNPVLFPNEYEYKAKDLFFNLLSWDDQIALIEINPDTEMRVSERPGFKEEYKAVVKGLYTSLADVDHSGQTTQLLEVMHSSLKEMKLQDESLYKEITHWLAARNMANVDLQGAVEEYDQAITLNSQNPATRFERARIYTRLARYEDALGDYERVITIIPESNIEPTEGSPPMTNTGQAEILTATFTPAAIIASTPLTISSTITPGVSILTAPPSFESTITPTSPTTSFSTPLQPRFITLGQRVAAVNNDIQQNQNLSSLLLNASSVDYPNLKAKGFNPLAAVTDRTSLVVLQADLTAVESSLQVFRGERLAFVLEQGGTAKVRSGDLIELNENSAGILVFSDNVQVELFRNAKVLLADIKQESDGSTQVTLNLSQGYLVPRLIGTGSSQVTVETPNAIIRSLENDTEFNVGMSLLPNGTIDVVVLKGAAEVSTPSGTDKVILRAGEAIGGSSNALPTFGTDTPVFSSTSTPDQISQSTFQPVQSQLQMPDLFLISPLDGEIYDQYPPAFDWIDLPNASRYEIQIDDQSDFSSPVFITTTTSSDIEIPKGLDTNGTVCEGSADYLYYWRVRALDSLGNLSPWSSSWSVTLRFRYIC